MTYAPLTVSTIQTDWYLPRSLDAVLGNSATSPTPDSKRKALRTDEHEKLIVWERGDGYFAAVNSLTDATYVTMWHDNKKIGDLTLGPGRSSNTKTFATVRDVGLLAKHRGHGLGLEMYKAALAYAHEKYHGIGGEHEQRSNKLQVPKIYRRLNAVEFLNGDLVVPRHTPEAMAVVKALQAREQLQIMECTMKVQRPKAF